MSKKIVLLLLLAFVVLTGCTSVDLRSVPDPDFSGANAYCRTPMLTVEVENNGNGSAGASVTRVIFDMGGGEQETDEKTTGALGAGESEMLQFDTPSRCWNPDCNFTIVVDANDDVKETDENNNTAEGLCIG